MNNQQNPNGEFLPEIRRARFNQLTIYDVTDSELEILERGAPDSLYLNFSIFLLSSAISFTVSLFTTTISDAKIFTVFVVFTVIGYIAGIFLLLLWKKNHTSVTKCVENIRKRLPPDGIQQQLNNVNENLE